MKEYLRNTRIFRSLPDEQIEELARGAELHQTKTGEVLVTRGDEADCLFVITKGEFEVFLPDQATAMEKVLNKLGPGEIFGEIAFFARGVRTATVRALGDGEVIKLAREAYVDAIKRNPEMGLALCQVLATYVAEITAREPVVLTGRLSDYPDANENQQYLPEAVARVCRAVVLSVDGDRILLGVENPLDEAGLHFLREVVSPLRPSFMSLSEQEVNSLLHRETPGESGEEEEPNSEGWQIESASDVATLEDNEIDRFLTYCFWWEDRFGASDLHLEPKRDRLQARLRVDGRLIRLERSVEPEVGARVVMRLKVIAALDITRRNIPQTGSFRLIREGVPRDIRISILPTENGEKAALRFIPVKKEGRRIGDLMDKSLALEVETLFQSPSGLILVTGPTGGGKTTTLYAGLQEVWDYDQTRNIVAVEDPIDLRLDFATQIGVSSAGELSFGRILRSVLRQDPDVILVGEIRDAESAGLALEAATTGHLVLSSLHTHFAVEAVSRLRSLGIPSYLIASSLSAVISQRLVASNCAACREQVSLAPDEEAALRERKVITTEGAPKVWKGKGCGFCRKAGTRGRVGLFEVMTVNSRVRELIHGGASGMELAAALDGSSFLPMARYAERLLVSGLVPPDAIIHAFPSHD